MLTGRWKWLAYMLAPAALVLGVAVQRYHVVAHDQSAWAGGGFGMFSTVDIPDGRARRGYVLTNLGPALIITPQLGSVTRSTYTRPQPEQMTAEAQALAASDWVIYGPESYRALWPAFPELMKAYFRSSPEWWLFLSDTTATPDATVRNLYPSRLAFPRRGAPSGGTPLLARIEGVRTEVWRPVFDNEAYRIGWELVTEGYAPTPTSSSPLAPIPNR